MRLYQDGRRVGEGVTEKLQVSETVPDSLVLGSEYFYLHCHVHLLESFVYQVRMLNQQVMQRH